MSCNHQLVIEHISDYVENGSGKNNMSPELKTQIESALSNCSECNETYHQCVKMYQMSHQWQDETAPEWHRTRYAVRPPVQTGSWLNWSALATSSLAILMVVFQLEVSSGINGLHISFGGGQTESKIASLVDIQLAEYKTEQEKLFQAKLENELEKQDSKNKLRMATWMDKNRQERQEDLKFVMSGWQSQRFEDRKLIDQQVAYLADNQIENNQVINQLIQKVGVTTPE